jgi:hypothetical protein
MGGKNSKSSSSSSSANQSSNKISQQDKAVLDLKNSRDRLRRYRNKLEIDEKRLADKAKMYMKEGR